MEGVDVHAFSVHPSCTMFSPGNDRVSLRSNLEVVGSFSPIRTAFFLPLFSSSQEMRLNELCPVQALCTYLGRTSSVGEVISSLCPGQNLKGATPS